MALTPMDIYNKEFKKSFRGYAEEEVDMFLDQVVDEYEKLQKANEAADEKIQSLTERLDHYRSLEETLKETLVTAQNTAEEVAENARKKAALIIDSAQREARNIIEKAGSQIEQAEKMDMELRRAAAVFKSRFVALLEAQLEFFRQETTDIKAQRSEVHAENISQTQAQVEDIQEPMDAIPSEQEPGFASAGGGESAATQQEPVEVLPLEEREEPLMPVQSSKQPIVSRQEQEAPLVSTQLTEEPIASLPDKEEPSTLAQLLEGPVEPLQEKRDPLTLVRPTEVSAPEISKPESVPYIYQEEPSAPNMSVQAEPKDMDEEELDDADALIREIQHYSALRNDEDTVPDEGFIIGSDD